MQRHGCTEAEVRQMVGPAAQPWHGGRLPQAVYAQQRGRHDMFRHEPPQTYGVRVKEQEDTSRGPPLPPGERGPSTSAKALFQRRKQWCADNDPLRPPRMRQTFSSSAADARELVPADARLEQLLNHGAVSGYEQRGVQLGPQDLGPPVLRPQGYEPPQPYQEPARAGYTDGTDLYRPYFYSYPVPAGY